MSTGNENNEAKGATPARTVKIEALIREDKYQIRDRLNRRAVRSYANSYRNGQRFPPVQVVQVGREGLILVDGYHRVEALLWLGRDSVEASIIPGEERQARWLATQANLTHGVQLNRKERRAGFKAYIKAGQHKDDRGNYKSYRTIAEELGFLSLGGVHRRMQLDFPALARKMGGNEEWKGKGGLDEAQDPQRALAILAFEHLTKARAALEGFTDPTERGEFIHHLKTLLGEMEQGEFQPYAPDF